MDMMQAAQAAADAAELQGEGIVPRLCWQPWDCQLHGPRAHTKSSSSEKLVVTPGAPSSFLLLVASLLLHDLACLSNMCFKIQCWLPSKHFPWILQDVPNNQCCDGCFILSRSSIQARQRGAIIDGIRDSITFGTEDKLQIPYTSGTGRRIKGKSQFFVLAMLRVLQCVLAIFNSVFQVGLGIGKSHILKP